jgi:hypothetical protein
VIASARWLVDALGAHRDALSEQLGGVQRRIDELPSLEAAAAVAGQKLATVPSDDQPVPQTPAATPAAAAPAAAATPAPATAAPAAPATATATVAATTAAPAPADNRPDEVNQPVRAVVRVPGAHAVYATDEAPSGDGPDGSAWGTNQAPPPGSAATPPAHAAPADTATLNRTWTPVNPRIGGAHRG